MKCIDAIEGAVKNILNRIHAVSLEDKLDDTEYVRLVKSIIDATDQFIGSNQEILENPQLLKEELYQYSRSLWLASVKASSMELSGPAPEADTENSEYQTYYYDFIYHRGVYPR